MNYVNHILIERALGYLAVPEATDGTPLVLDPNNGGSMKQAFAKYIRPNVESWSNNKRNTLKLSFAYFIQRPEILDYQVLAKVPDLPLCDDPIDIQAFFLWLYETLFPNDPISQIDVSEVIEKNDIWEFNFGTEDYRIEP